MRARRNQRKNRKEDKNKDTYMKTKLHINRSNNTNNTLAFSSSRRGKHKFALLGAAVAGVLLTAHMAPAQTVQQIGDVFVIAMENHNFTQPGTQTSPQQILGNPAAPFMNSLITPGNTNAAQASFATAYFNAGNGVHPSEPNYLWAE